MASFKYKINTQIGHPLVGTISVDITPDPLIAVDGGHYAFGVIAPNGVALKTIHPDFISNPSLPINPWRDYLATSPVVGNVLIATIPTDSNGDYMSGDYTFKVYYKEFLTDLTVSTFDEEVKYTFCNPKTTGLYKGVLSSKFNLVSNIAEIKDITNYTGLTVTSHNINSVRLTDSVSFSTTAYTQSLPIAPYSSALKADASKIFDTTLPNTKVEQIFTITASASSPTNLSTASQTLAKAAEFIKKMKGILCKKLKLSDVEQNKFNQVVACMALVSCYSSIGDEINFGIELTNLNNLLNKC